MSESPDSNAIESPRRRSRLLKWFNRLLIGAAVLFVLGLVVLFAARTYFRQTGTRDLNAEVARLDAEDPGWQLDAILEARARAAPPEAENSAVVVRKVRGLIPNEWKEWVRSRPVRADDEPPLPLNRRQTVEELMRDDELVEATKAARTLGLTLRNYPHGYREVNVGDLPFVESMDETQGAREVANLLRADALRATEQGDPVYGLRAAHAMLNTARSTRDEPSLIATFVRVALGTMTAEAAMRVLAQVDAPNTGEELAALQAALFAEAEEPLLLNGLRGERAIVYRFMDRVNNGTVGADAFAKMANEKPVPEHRASVYLFRTFLPEDTRRFLRLMSESIDSAKGPSQFRIARAEQIEAEIRANWDIRYPWNRLMMPAVSKVIEASVRHRAELLAAATLIACERFRLANGRWPQSLAEIPRTLLPAIPTDPYTGEPIKFAKLTDGIAVYSAAPSTIRSLDRKRLTNPLGGSEVGWRLYDPQQRGLPPLPPNPDADDPMARP
jgi:hypothetical protein